MKSQQPYHRQKQLSLKKGMKHRKGEIDDNQVPRDDLVTENAGNRKAEALTIDPTLAFFNDPSQLPHSTVNDYMNRISVGFKFYK